MALVVVLLTASSDDADIAAAYRLGANGFLVKPSDSVKLEGMVKAIKDFWLTHNTLPFERYREQVIVPQSSTLEKGREANKNYQGRIGLAEKSPQWPQAGL